MPRLLRLALPAVKWLADCEVIPEQMYDCNHVQNASALLSDAATACKAFIVCCEASNLSHDVVWCAGCVCTCYTHITHYRLWV